MSLIDICISMGNYSQKFPFCVTLNCYREMKKMATIDLKNISLSYGNNGTSHKALSNINLRIRNGEFITLIGPSGCGKSTIIDVISGLLSPSEGIVLLDGVQVEGPGTDRGTVFQDYSLFPWMTTFKNVCFAIEHSKEAGTHKGVEKMAQKFLDLVGLGKFKDKYPHTLSGGMRQRASIARMFSIDPKVFLMDEPFGALDSLNRMYMQDLLLHLWSKENITRLSCLLLMMWMKHFCFPTKSQS